MDKYDKQIAEISSTIRRRSIYELEKLVQVETQKAEAKPAVEESPWVAVERLLPETGKWVVAKCKDAECVHLVYFHHAFTDSFFMRYSHWMPIPPLPKCKGGSQCLTKPISPGPTAR